MKITGVKSAILQVPIHMSKEDVSLSRTDIQVTLVAVETDEGIIGHGYTYSDGYGGPAIKALLDLEIGELALGGNPLDVKSLVAKLYWEFRKIGRGGITSLAVAGFEIALWDIISKAANKPLVEILGGYRECVPVYSSAAAHRSLPVEEHIERIQGFIEKGFVGVKIKVARQNPKDDIERVRRIREAIGPDIKLMVDANSMWDVTQAITVGRRLAEFDVFWLEEPLPDYDYEGYAKVAGALQTPIATGEKLFSYHESAEYLKRGFVSFMQTDVCRVGGITEWLRVASLADTVSIKMVPHFVTELHTQLLCTIPNALYAEYLAFFSTYLKEPLVLKNGFAYARKEPGLGLEFDEKAIEKYRLA